MWTTATETNNEYFTLEVSEDGVSYREVARFAGAGNSNTLTAYSYLDTKTNAADKPVYYRLWQTDFDGARTSLGITTVMCSGDEGDLFTLYPNPARDYTNVIYRSRIEESAEITIYDALGQLVMQKSITLSEGLNETYLPIHVLAPGTYTVMYKTASRNLSPVKLIIVR